MAKVIGRARAAWEVGEYVLLWREELEIIGPVQVSRGGLDSALEDARAGERPELEVGCHEKQVQDWFTEWVWGRGELSTLPSTKRALTIRDNRRKRWFYLDGASVKNARGLVDSTGLMVFTIVAENLKEGEDGDGPGW